MVPFFFLPSLTVPLVVGFGRMMCCHPPIHHRSVRLGKGNQDPQPSGLELGLGGMVMDSEATTSIRPKHPLFFLPQPIRRMSGVVRLEVALVACPPGFEPPAVLAALSVVFARSSLFLRVGAWRGMSDLRQNRVMGGGSMDDVVRSSKAILQE